ncbi:MAG: transcriptional repressor [Butyricicoccus pullicaecorum]|nr:transcriptional repressor [Butyricicoccus pullicaecorum]
MVQTKQRQLIIRAVRESNRHPTADEIFQTIRCKLPSISLATVYRNLNLLAERGEIRKLSMPAMPDRFDWKLEPHDHLMCNSCNQVFDFYLSTDLKSQISQSCGDAQIDGYVLVAHGICPHCRSLS